jgi:hypothetical protein
LGRDNTKLEQRVAKHAKVITNEINQDLRVFETNIMQRLDALTNAYAGIASKAGIGISGDESGGDNDDSVAKSDNERDCEDDDARDKEGRDSGEKKQSDSSGSSTWDDNSKIAKADRPDLKAGDKIQYYQFGNQGIPRFLTETEVIAVDPANEYQPLTLRCGTVLRTILSGNIRRSNPPDRCWRPIRAYNLIESQTMTLGDCMREQASSFRATLGNNMKRVQGNGKAAGFAPMDVLQDMARTRNSSTGESSSSTGE